MRLDPAKARDQSRKALKIVPDATKEKTSVLIIGPDSISNVMRREATIRGADVPPGQFGHEAVELRNDEYISVSVFNHDGSLGSLALDINGNTMAIRSVGMLAAPFLCFMPFHYPQLILEGLRAGRTLRRGTIQASWGLIPLSRCELVQLPGEWARKIRDAGQNSAIQANAPGGSADGKVATGDILLEVDSDLVTRLREVSMYLDDHVGEDVTLTVWRERRMVKVTCPVRDLHEISPYRFRTRCGLVFHNLSLQMADYYQTSTTDAKGVFVAGTASCPAFQAGLLLESINEQPTHDMDQLGDGR